MNNKQVLDILVEQKTIVGYTLLDLDENGEVGKSQCRNTQKLILYFRDGTILDIGTFCTGSSEDTVLDITQER